MATKEYLYLLGQVFKKGHNTPSRAGYTRALPGGTLVFDGEEIPLLTCRKIHFNGVWGEFKTFMEGNITNNQQFKDNGCNYWGPWADADGQLRLDYGNSWRDWNGIDQVQDVIDRLNKDKYDRRALITGWNPSNISKLSLPCCHYSYQFLFIDYKLHLIWNQRSTDMVLGLPSDMLLAYFLLNYICDKTYLRPGSITMHLGSTHIYENHFAGVEEMLSNYSLPETHKLLLAGATNIGDLPNMIFVTDYQYNTINSKLEINV